MWLIFILLFFTGCTTQRTYLKDDINKIQLGMSRQEIKARFEHSGVTCKTIRLEQKNITLRCVVPQPMMNMLKEQGLIYALTAEPKKEIYTFYFVNDKLIKAYYLGTIDTKNDD